MNGFKKSYSQKKPLLQGFLLDFKKGKTIICLVALLMLATAKTSGKLPILGCPLLDGRQQAPV